MVEIRNSQSGKVIYRADVERLAGACLDGVDLRGANLQKADLTGASLRGTRLQGAFLWGASLVDADLRHAELTVANLTGANLTGARLDGSALDACILTGAKLIDASLRDVNLALAFLETADLTGADLRGALLLDTGLTGATLDGVAHDETTQWPDGFSVPGTAQAAGGEPPDNGASAGGAAAGPRLDTERRPLRPCPFCARPVSVSAHHCPGCANLLESLRPCAACGKPLSRHAVTCPECGHPANASRGGATQHVPAEVIQIERGSHSVGTAVLLSVLCCAVGGQLYNRQHGKGAALAAAHVLLALMTSGVSLLLTYPLLTVDAVLVAMRLNRGEPVSPWQFF